MAGNVNLTPWEWKAGCTKGWMEGKMDEVT